MEEKLRKINSDIRWSHPQWLFEMLKRDYGREKALELIRVTHEPAPVTIRINEIKMSRKEWLAKWKGATDASACSKSRVGVTFSKRISLQTREDFKQGFFEIQDEGKEIDQIISFQV